MANEDKTKPTIVEPREAKPPAVKLSGAMQAVVSIAEPLAKLAAAQTAHAPTQPTAHAWVEVQKACELLLAVVDNPPTEK